MVGGYIAMGGRRRVALRALLASLCAVAALAVAGAAPALAAPTLVIEAPASGSFTSSTEPPISGTTTYTPVVPAPVTINVYAGTSATGTPTQTLEATPSAEGHWSKVASLGEGTYTAVAEQTELIETGKSPEVTFTVKTAPPAVTLNPVASPTAESRPTLTGAAGKAEGDIQKVTVTIYEGEGVGGAVAASGSVVPTGSEWSYQPASALKDGTYTAQASQEDKAGNKATSEARTFTIKASAPKVTLDPVPSPSNNSTPTLKGAAGIATGDLQTVNVKIYEGESVGKGVAASGEAAVSGGEWKFTPASALKDGTYTAQAEQKDKAGNTGKSEPETFTIDTVAPLVTLDPVPSPSNNAKPTLKGEAGSEHGDLPLVAVKIHEGSGIGGSIVSSGSVAPSGSSWSYTPKAELSDGTYTAQAEQEDAAGNLGKSATQTFTVKASKPVVTLNPPAALSNNATPSFGGNADTRAGNIQSVTLRVYAGGEASGSAVRALSVSVSEGKWEAGPVEHLPDGTYTAQAEQKDQVGNIGFSGPATFTIDTAPPKISLSGVPTPTNDSTPTLEGVRGTGPHDEAVVSVTVYEGSSVGGPVAAASTFGVSGAAWSYTTSHLSDGTYTAQAEQKDTVGNVGKSAAVTFTIDTGVPEVTLNAVPTPSNNATPHLGGSAGNDSIDGAVKVTIYAGAAVGGSVANSGTAQRSGESWTYTPSHLPDGTYTAQATQQDAAGNQGTSASQTFTISTASPTVTLNSPAPVSNNTTPSFSGTATDTTPVTITVHNGPTTSGTVAWKATVGAVGEAWSTTPVALQEGKHTYTAIAAQKSSISGNPEGTSVPVTFIVETTAPTVTLNAQAKPRSNVATPSFTGTASDTSSVTVNVYKGKVVKGSPLTSASGVPAAGVWTSGPTLASLADGEYTAQATQPSSIAGNPAGVSAAINFIIDTKPPAVSMTPLKSQINTPGPELTGQVGTEKGDIAKVAVKVYKNAEVVGGVVVGGEVVLEGEGKITTVGTATSWSYKSSNLPDGTYTAQATQADEAENTGHSVPVTFTIDTVKPTVTLSPPPSPSNNQSPSFTGTSSEAGSVLVAVYSGAKAEGTPVTTVVTTAIGAGEWKTTPVTGALANHAYTAVATVTDEAGNAEVSAPAHFIVDTLAPTVTLDPVRSPSNNRTPAFSGFAEDHKPVLIRVFAANGSVAATAEAPGTGGRWSSPQASPALADGIYTVTARQESSAGNHPGETAPATLIVDTEQPRVKLTEPANGATSRGDSQIVGGSTEGDADDGSIVIVQLFSGGTISPGQASLQARTANVIAGRWSARFVGLGAGEYSVRAEQFDNAGNIGVSGTSTFSLQPALVASPAGGHPLAAFSWYPAAPHAGERVTLVSGSTDPTSALTSFAWDLAGTGSFQPAGQVVSTSFASVGNHVVRLRVTDATSASNLATETIPVRPPEAAVMQPFPLVRIVTTRSGSSVRLRLLSIVAAPGARITITCKGRGCPVRKQSKIAATGKVGLASVSFARFERQLPSGTTLEIRVSRPGEVGKYTRLSIRRGALKRIDACLATDGVEPIPCPSS